MFTETKLTIYNFVFDEVFKSRMSGKCPWIMCWRYPWFLFWTEHLMATHLAHWPDFPLQNRPRDGIGAHFNVTLWCNQHQHQSFYQRLLDILRLIVYCLFLNKPETELEIGPYIQACYLYSLKEAHIYYSILNICFVHPLPPLKQAISTLPKYCRMNRSTLVMRPICRLVVTVALFVS